MEPPELPTSPTPPPLKAVREAKGWKASRLAGEVGVTETTLSRWENGHQQPRRGYQRRLCEILGVDPADLGFEEDLLEVDRRRFVKQLLQVAAAGAVAPLLEFGGGQDDGEPLERLALVIRRPSRVDTCTVEHLEAVTQSHRDLYHSLGPFELLSEINGHLRTLVLLLADARRSTLRRRLAAMAGETAGHAAWLSFDIQHRRAMARYYEVASVAIREAGAPALDGYIRGFRSIVRRSEGAAGDALLLAQDASGLAAKSATPTTSSWLKGLEAQALAAIGDRQGCFAALKRSEAAIERSRADEDPAWMYRFDRGRFAVLAGSCYRRLGKTAPAKRTLEEALVLLGPACSPRRQAEVLLELGYVEVQQGDLDQACELAGRALAGYLQAGSVSGVQHVRQFRVQLDESGGRRRESRAVAWLDERLADVRAP